jgi:hypothetical protein
MGDNLVDQTSSQDHNPLICMTVRFNEAFSRSQSGKRRSVPSQPE